MIVAISASHDLHKKLPKVRWATAKIAKNNGLSGSTATHESIFSQALRVGVGSPDSLAIGAAKPQEGAFASVSGLRGASPLQVDVLRPVVDRNCVAARRGGEHREAKDQSATQVNSIRPGCLASLPSYGEAQTGVIRKSSTLRGNVSKRSTEQPGGWRQNGRKSWHRKQRDLPGRLSRAGVRGAIVAWKPGNSGGAKGSRKMEGA